LFPHGGQLTSWLEKQEIGTKILIDGPYKRIEYYGNGYIKVGGKVVRKVISFE
jgi:hypothetical protein